MRCTFKVSIVGCGSVGAAAAYAMLLDGTPTDLTLIDMSKERARGLVTDLEHALSFTEYTKLEGGNDMKMCRGSNVVFVTAGARQKEGESRLDLIKTNRKIFKDIIPKIAKAAPKSIIVIVSNPVDILTYDAIKLAKFPPGRVFGTGTMLDTIRFQFHIGEKWGVNPKSVEAYILGEHGDSSFPVYSAAEIAGKNLIKFKDFKKKDLVEAYKTTREAAYRIINDLGYTCYSIGVVMREIMKHVYDNSRIVVPLSTLVDKYHGHSKVCLSVPCVLGQNGIERTIEIPLDKAEKKALKKSATVLKNLL
jgi:L-lactate dehydrogenase